MHQNFCHKEFVPKNKAELCLKKIYQKEEELNDKKEENCLQDCEQEILKPVAQSTAKPKRKYSKTLTPKSIISSPNKFSCSVPNCTAMAFNTKFLLVLHQKLRHEKWEPNVRIPCPLCTQAHTPYGRNGIEMHLKACEPVYIKCVVKGSLILKKYDIFPQQPIFFSKTLV